MFLKLTMKIRCPESSPLKGPFMELVNKSGARTGQDWVEVWRTELIRLSFEYEYYPGRTKFRSALPVKYLKQFMPLQPTHPAQLLPDNLFVEVPFEMVHL